MYDDHYGMCCSQDATERSTTDYVNGCRRSERITKVIIATVVLVFTTIMAIALTGCRPADRVSHNVSKEADSFNVTRKLTVINVLSDRIIQEVTGTFSIHTNANHELEVICKIGDDEYKKHFVYLNDWTVYTVEDISGADVDPYKYEITFYPSMLPITDVDISLDGILGG